MTQPEPAQSAEAGFGVLARHTAEAAHELRTPLTVLIAQLEVALRHTRTTAEWEATAAGALNELRRLSRLVQGLLEWARADAPPRQPSLIDVRERVDLLLASFSDHAKRRQILLSSCTEGDGGDACLNGDPDAIDAAVRNVLANALRYTPNGGRVRARLDLGLEHVDVVVDDSGPGVPVNERDSIFQPLWRGCPRDTEADAGHGLGLAVVERVLQHHGGSATVGTSPEGGARFVLRLPRRHATWTSG